jgi:dienelactone hydrolase
MKIPNLGAGSAYAVAAEPIAGLIAFLFSDAAAPVSRAILPAYGGLPGMTRRRANHHDPVMTSHQSRGDAGPVANPRTAFTGRARATRRYRDFTSIRR